MNSNFERYPRGPELGVDMADEGGSFDALDYLNTRFSDLSAKDRVLFQLDRLHELYTSPDISGRDGLKVLDYGSGPVLQHGISAAAYASEIVFCDISPANREAIQKWLNGAPDAFNWSPHFDYVVKTLEGKGDKEAREREERMRKISKVVFCDALSDTPMETGYEGPYDIVLDSGCLDAACSDKQSYKKSVKNLIPLIKPGGLLVRSAPNALSEDVGKLVYKVGGKEHSCIRLTHEFVESILKECGLHDISVSFVALAKSRDAIYHEALMKTANGFHFITAKK